MTLKEADLAAAETDVYVKGRTYDAAESKKNNLVDAKNTPYTYQYVELLGSNFASEGMDGKFAFAVDFKHSDTLVSGPPPDGLGQRWLLRQKTYGGTVSACNTTTDDTPCCPVWTHTRLVCKVPQASGAWLKIVYCFETIVLKNFVLKIVTTRVIVGDLQLQIRIKCFFRMFRILHSPF